MQQLDLINEDCSTQRKRIATTTILTLRDKGIKDITPLLNLPLLQTLDLSHNKILNADRLFSSLKHLRRVDLSHNQISHVTLIDNHDTLVELNVDFQKSPLKFSNFDRLTRLKRLSVKKTGISTIGDLGALPQSLSTLDVSWNPIGDVDELGSALETLNINFFATPRLCQNPRVKHYRRIEDVCQARAEKKQTRRNR